MKLLCQEKVFKCHKFILSTRSPVFKAMFESDMIENERNEVIVQDVNPEALLQVLNFIYTGKSPDKLALLCEILPVADYYQIEMLKNLCVVKMVNTIKFNNCVDYLLLGHIHNAIFLKNFALKFLVKNVTAICKTEDWKEKILQHPNLMAEIIETFGEKEG